jgi:hypothetical protein
MHRAFEGRDAESDVIDQLVDPADELAVIVGCVGVVAAPDELVVAAVDTAAIAVDHRANRVLFGDRAEVGVKAASRRALVEILMTHLALE